MMVEKVRGRSLLTPCPARAVAASDLQGLQALERRGWTRVRGFNHIMAIAAVTLPIDLQDWNHSFAVKRHIFTTFCPSEQYFAPLSSGDWKHRFA